MYRYMVMVIGRCAESCRVRFCMRVLELQEVKKTFRKNKNSFTAVDGVSFHIEAGECVGLVGESGCGKSTIARLITHLEKVDSGEITVHGQNIARLKGKALRESYQKLQMIFQNPSDSFNPRLKLGSSIGEGFINFGKSRGEVKQKVTQLLEQVGLKAEYASRYPHEISGGQCQRAAIARAIAVEPDLLICDEATSALDVSIQAQIVDLILKLQKELHMSYLFISHDLALVQSICNRVLVMHHGRIVEKGTTQDVIEHAVHPYTQLLLSSVFPINPGKRWEISSIPQLNANADEGEACKFWQRCPYCIQRCKQERPQLIQLNGSHRAACHLIDASKC